MLATGPEGLEHEARTTTFGTWNHEEMQRRVETAWHTLQASSGGLLEITVTVEDGAMTNKSVRYMHQSVKGFSEQHIRTRPVEQYVRSLLHAPILRLKHFEPQCENTPFISLFGSALTFAKFLNSTESWAASELLMLVELRRLLHSEIPVAFKPSQVEELRLQEMLNATVDFVTTSGSGEDLATIEVLTAHRPKAP